MSEPYIPRHILQYQVDRYATRGIIFTVTIVGMQATTTLIGLYYVWHQRKLPILDADTIVPFNSGALVQLNLVSTADKIYLETNMLYFIIENVSCKDRNENRLIIIILER